MNFLLHRLQYFAILFKAFKHRYNFTKQAVKVDINIEKDLAFALKIRECPQILFLRGNRILYREKRKTIHFFMIYLSHILFDW